MNETLAKGLASNATVRDHLANKRTMLAWIRTAVAVIALGVVAALFGLLSELRLAALARRLPKGVSTAFGTLLVAIGG